LLEADDLGLGSITRIYSTEISGGQGQCIGRSWRLNGLPHLINDTKQIMVSFGPRHAYWYNVSGDSYTPQFGAAQTLTHDAENHLFKFFDTNGTTYEFYDFDGSHAGQFHRSVTPGGAGIEITDWTPRGKIKIVQYKVSSTAISSKLWEYSYVTGGENDGWLESIVLRGRTSPSKSWTDNETQLRRVTYSYYVTGASEPHGMTGDLKTAIRQIWNASSWVGNDTYYYRYYIDTPRAHLLKMALSPQGYEDVKAVYPDPTSSNVSDENLIRFSHRYYDYNTDRKVIKAIINGKTESRFDYPGKDKGGTKMRQPSNQR
jgi:hypothetical protein